MLCPGGFSEVTLKSTITERFRQMLETVIGSQPFSNRHEATSVASRVTATPGATTDAMTYSQAETISTPSIANVPARSDGKNARSVAPANYSTTDPSEYAPTPPPVAEIGFRTTIQNVFVAAFETTMAGCGVQLNAMAMARVEVQDLAVREATLAAAKARAAFETQQITNETELAKARMASQTIAAAAEGAARKLAIETNAQVAQQRAAADAKLYEKQKEAEGVRAIGEAKGSAIKAEVDAMASAPPGLISQKMVDALSTAYQGATQGATVFYGDPMAAVARSMLGTMEQLSSAARGTLLQQALPPRDQKALN